MDDLLAEISRCIALLDATVAVARANSGKRAEVFRRVILTNPATLRKAGVEL